MALGDGPAEASLLSNLAIVAEYEEDYDVAQELNEQALDLRVRLGDRWGIGVSRNNLGMIAYLRHDYAGRPGPSRRSPADRARGRATSGWSPWPAHNLGNATRELGDVAAAGRNYAEALATYGSTGRQVGAVPAVRGRRHARALTADPRAALRLVGAAEAMREAIGSPRVAAQQAELDERLRPAGRYWGEEAAAEHAAGLGLGPDAALQLALQLCGGPAGAERQSDVTLMAACVKPPAAICSPALVPLRSAVLSRECGGPGTQRGRPRAEQPYDFGLPCT